MLRWFFEIAYRPLAAAHGIPVLEPIVEYNSRIDIDHCNDGNDDKNGRHICTSQEHR
jgi:hypothetical protein